MLPKQNSVGMSTTIFSFKYIDILLRNNTIIMETQATFCPSFTKVNIKRFLCSVYTTMKSSICILSNNTSYVYSYLYDKTNYWQQ